MIQDDFEPRHKEMGRHVVSGFLNSGIVQIIGIACQFASVIFLSRLLSPSDFGIFAMAGPIFGFVMLFQDLGLSQATVQKPDLNGDEVNAFFWINIAVAAILSLSLMALSPVVGWYYGDHRVVPLTAALGALVLLNALGSQHGAILRRRMEFGISSLIATVGVVSGLAVSLIWAVLFKTYWAIYFGQLVGVAIPVIGVWIAVKWRPGMPRKVSGLHDMLKFGAAVTSVNVTNFITRNLDNVLIGRRWGDEILGYYDRAYKLLLFPIQRIVDPVSSTMIPVLSRLLDEPERYRSIFLRTLAQIALITWPGIVWAILSADILIPTLLGPVWVSSVPIFQALAMAGLLQAVNSASNWLFVTQRRSGEYTRWGIFNAVTCVIAFAIGLPYGAFGVATAYAISEYIRTPILWWYVTRRGPVKLMEIIRAILPQTLSSAASCVIVLIIRHIGVASPITVLAGGVILSYMAAILTMMIFPGGRETLMQTVKFAQRALQHVTSKNVTPIA